MRMDLWHRVFSLAKSISGPLGRLTAVLMAIALSSLITLPPEFYQQSIGLIMVPIGLALLIILILVPLMIMRLGVQRLKKQPEAKIMRPIRPLFKSAGRSLMVFLLSVLLAWALSVCIFLGFNDFFPNLSADAAATLHFSVGFLLVIFIGYVGIRALPYMGAPLGGHEVGMKMSWRLTKAKGVSFMLPLIPIFVLSTALDYLLVLIEGGLFPSIAMMLLRVLMFVLMSLYCAVAYDELVSEPGAAK